MRGCNRRWDQLLVGKSAQKSSLQYPSVLLGWSQAVLLFLYFFYSLLLLVPDVDEPMNLKNYLDVGVQHWLISLIFGFFKKCPRLLRLARSCLEMLGIETKIGWITLFYYHQLISHDFSSYLVFIVSNRAQ